MWKSFVACGVLLGGLVVWDVLLTNREDEARRNIVRVGRLFTKEERAAKETKGIVIETQAGEKFTYKKISADEWRCTSYKNAIASTEHIERGLLTKIFESEGHVQSDDSRLAAQYGLDGPSMLRVTVHGPGLLEKTERADVIAAVDIGNSLQDKEGSFMRRTGQQKIWSMDANPHPELDRPAGVKIPPLLDPSMVPMFWFAKAQRVKRIKVERGNAKPFELEVRDKQISPEEMRQGVSPIDWYFLQDGKEKLAEQPAALAFTTVLMRAPYSDVLESTQPVFEALGFNRPAAKLTLTPAEGPPMELYVGSVATPSKKYAIYNSTTQLIYECEVGIVNLLFPQEPMLLTPGANPWKQLLDMMQPK